MQTLVNNSVSKVRNGRKFWYSRRQSLHRLLAVLLVALLVLPGQVVPTAQAQTSGEDLSVIVILRDQVQMAEIAPSARADRAERIKTVVGALRVRAGASQPGLLKRLEQLRAADEVSRVQPLWIINAVALTAQPAVIDEIRRRPDVERVVEDHPIVIAGPVGPATSILAPEAVVNNIIQTGAPEMWNAGYTGQGIVVANLDSGVSLDNPDLAAKWRGGNNSWLDVHGENALPTDNASGATGHGTATMSIMVGSNTGMAPGAKWIAVKLFSNSGGASFSHAAQGMQWALDPDGNPATADGANVINNSWTSTTLGCDEAAAIVQPVLNNLLAAGVLPVFSAGNYGQHGSVTDTSPGNYPGALSVGSIEADNTISVFSSRGPNSCAKQTIFPDLVAPGGMVPVQGLSGESYAMNGTSFSAPHVAGALALLLDAFPNMPASVQRQILRDTAFDLGAPGPDNTFGTGKLNVLSAYQSQVGTQPPPPIKDKYFYIPFVVSP